MCEHQDSTIVRAMVVYLEESLSTESELRELLREAGFNDPDLTLGECVAALVSAYLLRGAPQV